MSAALRLTYSTIGRQLLQSVKFKITSPNILRLQSAFKGNYS